MSEQAQSEQSHDLAEVKPWLNTMADRGVIPKSSARLRATAIEQLATVLGPEEPRDLGTFLGGLEEVTRRWATRNAANPETAATYQQRARRALVDFLSFHADPTGFRPKEAKVVRLVQEEGGKAARRARGSQVGQEEPVAPGAQPERSYPLGDGAEFFYRIPARGMTTREVHKIAMHLTTMASDFDPSAKAQRNPLARTEDDE